MAFDGLITAFLGQGLAAARPVTPNVDPDAIVFWYSTDSNQASLYADGAWIEDVFGAAGGDMSSANNLSDVANVATARSNLGLAIGTNVQAYDAELAALAGLTSAADKLAYFTGSGTASLADLTSVARTLIAQTTQALMRTTGLGMSANGSSLVAAADYAAMKALLDLEIGTDIPARSPVIQSVSSSATVTPTFADDQVIITAQAAGLTLANPTGTAVDGWGISVRIKDNGTARSIGYGSQYRAIGVTLPTTTVISKTLYLGMVFNNADTKWDVVAVAQET